MTTLTEKYLLTIVKCGDNAEIPPLGASEIAMTLAPVEFEVLKQEWRPSRLAEVDTLLYVVDASRGDLFIVMLPNDRMRLVRVTSGIVNNANHAKGITWKAACLPGDEVIALRRENDGKYVACETLSYKNH